MGQALRDWLGTFFRILTRPTTTTFQEEAQKAKGKLTGAILWIEGMLLMVYIAVYLYSGYIYPPSAILAAIIFLPIIFLFYVFCVYTICRRVFRCTKEMYDELLYLMTSIGVIGVSIETFTLCIPAPLNEVLSGGVLIYLAVLLVIALRAIVKLKIWEAIITVILGALLGAIGFMCIPTFVLTFSRRLSGM